MIQPSSRIAGRNTSNTSRPTPRTIVGLPPGGNRWKRRPRMPRLCHSRNVAGAMRVSVMATPRKRSGKRVERIEHHAVVEAVRIALHDHAARDAEVVVQRDELLDRRLRRRVAAAGRERKPLDRTEDMRMRVPRARRPASRRGGADARPGRRSAAVRLQAYSGACSSELDVGFLDHTLPLFHLRLSRRRGIRRACSRGIRH